MKATSGPHSWNARSACRMLSSRMRRMLSSRMQPAPNYKGRFGRYGSRGPRVPCGILRSKLTRVRLAASCSRSPGCSGTMLAA
jgi:hypothetical protein